MWVMGSQQAIPKTLKEYLGLPTRDPANVISCAKGAYKVHEEVYHLAHGAFEWLAVGTPTGLVPTMTIKTSTPVPAGTPQAKRVIRRAQREAMEEVETLVSPHFHFDVDLRDGMGNSDDEWMEEAGDAPRHSEDPDVPMSGEGSPIVVIEGDTSGEEVEEGEVPRADAPPTSAPAAQPVPAPEVPPTATSEAPPASVSEAQPVVPPGVETTEKWEVVEVTRQQPVNPPPT